VSAHRRRSAASFETSVGLFGEALGVRRVLVREGM
jgi:hypothetical protein